MTKERGGRPVKHPATTHRLAASIITNVFNYSSSTRSSLIAGVPLFDCVAVSVAGGCRSCISKQCSQQSGDKSMLLTAETETNIPKRLITGTLLPVQHDAIRQWRLIEMLNFFPCGPNVMVGGVVSACLHQFASLIAECGTGEGSYRPTASSPLFQSICHQRALTILLTNNHLLRKKFEVVLPDSDGLY